MKVREKNFMKFSPMPHGVTLTYKMKSELSMCSCVLGCVWFFATPWTIAHQAPLSTEFSRQEHWSGLPFPSPQRDTKINLLHSSPWESWRQVPDKELEKLSSENRKTDLDPYLQNCIVMPQAEDQNILWLTASHPAVKLIMHTKLPISSVGSHSS